MRTKGSNKGNEIQKGQKSSLIFVFFSAHKCAALDRIRYKSNWGQRYIKNTAVEKLSTQNFYVISISR